MRTFLLLFVALFYATSFAQVAPEIKELDLAYQYLMAIDVSKNDAKARAYFKEAAEKYDNDEAYSMLSFMYESGMGGEKDMAKSVKILARLAEKNNLHAQNLLAHNYLEGFGVEKNFDKAFYWAQKAHQTKPDDLTSNATLGFHYYLGLGTPQNFKKAYEYYKVAAELGDANAQVLLSELLSLGLGTDQNLKEALYWTEKAYAQGDSYARKKLSNIYQMGQRTDSDLQKPFKFLLAAATTGDAASQYGVATSYDLGIGIEIDPMKSLMWTQRSCKKGYQPACDFIKDMEKEIEANPEEI